MNDLTTVNAGDIVEYSPSQIDLIKNSYAKGVSDDELKLFVAVSKRVGLDIFAKQIYAVKRWSKALGTQVMTIQTGIDGYRSIAERTGKYAGSSLPIFEYGLKGELISASICVKKLVGNIVCEFWAIAYWNEYFPKDAKNQTMWLERPKGMLSKCAESLALRKAFPLELSGLYTEEELEKDYAHQDKVDETCQRAEAMDYKAQPEQIKRLELACLVATKGMTKEEKLKWLKTVIGCAWGDLGKKTKQELDELIKKAEGSRPIDAEKITTEQVKWEE